MKDRDLMRALGRVAAHGAEGVLIGLGVGVVVGCFRRTHDSVSALLLPWLGTARVHPWIVPAWFAVLVVLAWVLGRLVKAAPLIPGSGIPQTELVLSGDLPVPPSTWPKVLAAKFAGGWLAITAGLSLGREGPCIQMGGALGAMVALIARMRGGARQRNNPAIIAGAAAGLAAAFGSPTAGMLFAFEEMKSPGSAVNIVAATASAYTAEAVIEHVFGLGRLFPFAHFQPPALAEAWTLLPLGLLLGALGVVYNRCLLWMKDREARQTLLPQSLRALPPLLAAGALAFLYPQALGGGDGLIVRLGQESYTFQALLLLAGLKFLFSLYSYTGATPGGLLMPLICIGAIFGHMAGQALAAWGLVPPEAAHSYIIFAMAGYFAAIVRAPLTGIALVTEMSGANTCLPGALAVAFLANITATALRCPPVYDSLKARIPLPRRPGEPGFSPGEAASPAKTDGV